MNVLFFPPFPLRIVDEHVVVKRPGELLEGGVYAAIEIDLVVEGPDGQVVAIEIKLSATVGDADVRHLLWLRDQMPDDVADLVVVTTGKYAYRRPDGVAVIPLGLLGA